MERFKNFPSRIQDFSEPLAELNKKRNSPLAARSDTINRLGGNVITCETVGDVLNKYRKPTTKPEFPIILPDFVNKYRQRNK